MKRDKYESYATLPVSKTFIVDLQGTITLVKSENQVCLEILADKYRKVAQEALEALENDVVAINKQ